MNRFWLDAVMLTLTSAQTIAMRCWLMWPHAGRASGWQRREAAAMVSEKVAALNEAGIDAALLMWRSWLAPWTILAPRASAGALRPWLSRTRRNSRRLARRVAHPRIPRAR
ncbi:MAG TPA: hypothetical protein VM491_06020 [Burkholderiaceae bacterium]|nr:hypothetical protein [Burkholderiaceae bacterium]